LGVFGAFKYPHNALNFSAYVLQNGVRIPIDQHIVKLKRSEFDIIVDMPNKEGVFINISYSSNTYNGALKNTPVNDLKGFTEVAFFELWKNQNQELLVSDIQPNFWFIDSRANHRFSSYEWVNNRYISTRKVSKIYDTNKNIGYNVTEAKKPLYLTFIQFDSEGDNFRKKELMRTEFKIEWID
jgi:hypothetical protein